MTPFRHKCDARGCWLERRWDSNLLGRAAESEDGRWPFPRGISPSDIDGFMECAGQVLFIETKDHGAPIPRGQERALEALAQLGATVLVQECSPPNTDSVVRTRLCVKGSWKEWQSMDRLQRDRLVQEWFEWAEGEPVEKAA